MVDTIVATLISMLVFLCAYIVPPPKPVIKCDIVGIVTPLGANVLSVPGTVMHNPHYKSPVKAGDFIVDGSCF